MSRKALRKAIPEPEAMDEGSINKPLQLVAKGGKQPHLWDRYAWKPVEIESIPGLDGGMFLGLEEIDGSVFSSYKPSNKKSSITHHKANVDEDDEFSEVLGDKREEKATKKKEKRKRESGDEKGETNLPKKTKTVQDSSESSKEKKKVQKANDETTKSTVIKDESNKSKQKKVSTKSDSKQKNANTILKPIPDETALWGGIQLHSILSNALNQLEFKTPTPIQSSSVPVALKSTDDIVGIAETGSGKTLSFALPILNTIISEWSVYGRCVTPMALIIAPTRELVMQISTVFNEIIACCTNYCKVEVVTVIGGMSEQKQIRLLSGTLKRPVHVIVATPGRLHELVFENDGEIPIFDDMSRLRYLVVDEVDRIMEEGHFNELHKIFSRIREHEKLCDSGKSPISEARSRAEGGDYEVEDDSNDKNKENIDDDEEVEKMGVVDLPFLKDNTNYADDNDDAAHVVENDDENEDDQIVEQEDFLEEQSNDFESKLPAYIPRQRQTLLFSATANQKQGNDSKKEKGKRLKGIGDGAVRQLPRHVQELLALVALKKSTQVIDVTKQKASTSSNERPDTKTDEFSTAVTLPKTLSQYEIRVPLEDKDLVAYQFLLQASGRTLVFVNSIKNARRLDGLLRALDLNSRAIHAELQQKQRMKALESFKSSPVAILVATDVAARGLDIPMINTVLHYDIARSPQLYIHRSGRTARASASGTAVSLVTPEEIHHHEAICQALAVKRLDVWRNHQAGKINEQLLLDRVKLAKKIFTQSFVQSQQSKEEEWLKHNVKDTGLDFEEIEEDNKGKDKNFRFKDESKRLESLQPKKVETVSKKELAKMRAELRGLLDTPTEIVQMKFKNKPRFIVVAK